MKFRVKEGEIVYEPEIAIENISKTHISISLKSRAVAELDRADFLVDQYDGLVPPVFWFARIKSVTESQGDGTFLMKRLCRHADELGVTIVNEINPYGRMDMDELQEWFQKFGFELIRDGLVIRKPKCLTDNQSSD
jgi:hypothetical protein